MAIFKCKMCGGTLEINHNETVAVCEYCGTKQTLPKLDDEKRVQLYDRSNHFRRENEFDKAMGIYEMILSDDKEDCESYWGLVLCRYGIEYVEDPKTHKRIPTVNRAQFVSIFDDEDYRSAIKYADGYQREIYEAEAGVIDNIQKRILEISSKEEPFDVFICYKENDRNGNRTQDSVYAQDVYTALTKEGYKVFFSRITLEDKLGSAYEPYIFAALNSARVMLVVGTEKDNFNAVWVKNEWSRYLALIKSGKEKTLIPVYKNMSPYDMPEEFQYLQSQDMGKVGSIQDIVRGVKKLIDSKTIKEQHTTETTSVIINTMLKRAQEALSNGEWQKATRCYDNVLDYDNLNESAYIGKLLIDFKVSSLDELNKYHEPIASNKYYAYLMENGNPEIINKLKEISDAIEERVLAEHRERTEKTKQIRKKTIMIISIAVTISAVFVCSFFAIKYYFIPNNNYRKAVALMENGSYEEAINSFIALDDFKNSKEMITETKYLEVLDYMNKSDYDTALKYLDTYGFLTNEYKDSQSIYAECVYQKGKISYDNGDFDSAISCFKLIPEYQDADALLKEATFCIGNNHYDSNAYYKAIKYYETIPGYKDVNEKMIEAKYQYCVETKNNPTNNTRTYIKELIGLNYKNSSDISKTIFAWRADVRIYVSLRLGSQTGVGFDANLQGGDGTSTKIKFVISSSGETHTYCDEQLYSAGNTASCQLSSPFIDLTKESYTVRVYDGNGNLIATKTGVPTDN